MILSAFDYERFLAEFSKTVRVRIAEKGLSQTDAARQIPISKATLSRVCRGYAPDLRSYKLITKWLRDK